MVDPTDKYTKHIKDRKSMGTEGYLEYTEEKEKGKVNQSSWSTRSEFV